jgi:hypothetical protein
MNAGQWSHEEHRLFLKGMQLYPKDWVAIQDVVKTRTTVQVR